MTWETGSSRTPCDLLTPFLPARAERGPSPPSKCAIRTEAPSEDRRKSRLSVDEAGVPEEDAVVPVEDEAAGLPNHHQRQGRHRGVKEERAGGIPAQMGPQTPLVRFIGNLDAVHIIVNSPGAVLGQIYVQCHQIKSEIQCSTKRNLPLKLKL